MMKKHEKVVVVSNPKILGGTPVVQGTRVPAQNVMAEVKAGTSRVEIFMAYPSLPPDGIDACIEWASKSAGGS
jgi:uncharacterized protein (DUF433 family)